MPIKKYKKNPPLKNNKKEVEPLKKTDIQQQLVVKLKNKKGAITDNERKELISQYSSLIQAIVANIVSTGKMPPNLTFNDLVGFGVEGLLKAWENYQENRGIKFSVFASYRVRGEILDRIRKEWKYNNPGGYKTIYGKVERNVAQAANDTSKNNVGNNEEEKVRDLIANSAMAYLLSYEAINEEAVDENRDPGEEVTNRVDFYEERKHLWDAIRTLAEDEKKIIKAFYIEDKTQNEISVEMGYSKSKVSRMHTSILNKLRIRLQRNLRRL